ncbi:MAG: DNA-3-methyladenine glycosylase I [Halopseudomonas sp.]|uniref:DNA-3-methyladenine glycosylase I n=1 Tax=Halopseudomonas sp. TaxID=2901191 RepID=UPI0030015822
MVNEAAPLARCQWGSGDPLYQQYHDEEWGVPCRDANALFEMLMLEGFQAGLSWITVLRKREHYRHLYRNFDPQFMANQSDEQLQELLQDAGIIRNRLKVYGARRNAQAWLALSEQQDPVAWLWQFVEGRPQVNDFAGLGDIPAQTPAAQRMSKALKKAGFTFVGPTICYAFMQATGMVMDHTRDCHRFAALAAAA